MFAMAKLNRSKEAEAFEYLEARGFTLREECWTVPFDFHINAEDEERLQYLYAEWGYPEAVYQIPPPRERMH